MKLSLAVMVDANGMGPIVRDKFERWEGSNPAGIRLRSCQRLGRAEVFALPYLYHRRVATRTPFYFNAYGVSPRAELFSLLRALQHRGEELARSIRSGTARGLV